MSPRAPADCFFAPPMPTPFAMPLPRIDEAQKIEFAAAPPLVSRELFHLFALIGVVLLVLASYETHFRAAREQAVT